MRKNTDENRVRDISKGLSHAVSLQPKEFGIIQHPFASQIPINRNGEWIDFSNEDECKKCLSEIDKRIDSIDIGRLFSIYVSNPWKLTWLKFAKPYLSKTDFSRFLKEAWISEENPNMDANVPISMLIQWFKQADKQELMSPEEYEYWKKLPGKVILYRGVSFGRTTYGLSWTTDKSNAQWFQQRFAMTGHPGKLLKVIADKENCFCYFSGEQEIVLNVNVVKKDIEEI